VPAVALLPDQRPRDGPQGRTLTRLGQLGCVRPRRGTPTAPCWSQDPLQVHHLVHAHAQQCPLPIRRELVQCHQVPKEAADALLQVLPDEGVRPDRQAHDDHPLSGDIDVVRLRLLPQALRDPAADEQPALGQDDLSVFDAVLG
jgi:hypothetical protein